jgi:hypothetical protein
MHQKQLHTGEFRLACLNCVIDVDLFATKENMLKKTCASKVQQTNKAKQFY